MADSGEPDATASTENQDETPIEVEVVEDEVKDEAPAVEAPEERESWGSRAAYLLTLVGYAVGFGNIWRFPYVMLENGGLAFLIPYCIMLTIIGIPMFFLELAVGQRRRKGIIYAWNEISPSMGGIGMCCGWLCFMIGLYYNTLLAYCLSYFFDSFRSQLPWKSCEDAVPMDRFPEWYAECEEHMDGRVTKYYWNRRTLDISTGLRDIGNYNWWLFLYHVIAWSIIWAILWKGMKTVGVVVYITALFPYVVLIIFFGVNIFSEPAKRWVGAYRLLRPNWAALGTVEPWLRAGSQIFFSLGLALGCLVVFASYNPPRNNVHRDAIAISLINCGTSVFGALVIFPMIGYLGYTKYEECVSTMMGYLPGLGLEAARERAQDIYFSTNATKWEEVSASNPIIGRYDFGKIEDATQKRSEDEIFDTTNAATLPTSISHFGTVLKSNLTDPNHISNFRNLLRGCSIGQEATDSGGGSGFVFIGFTEAVKAFGTVGENIMGILFFTMLLTLGIDSGFGTVEGAIAAIQDLTHWSRKVVSSIVCGSLMVLALLLFPFGYGRYVLDVIDSYTANWTLLSIALTECIAVAWVYGLAKISYDVKLMTGRKPNLYILFAWKFFSPLVIIALLIGSIVEYCVTAYKDGGLKYTIFMPSHPDAAIGDVKVMYPPESIITGFLLMVFCMMWIPIHMILRNTRFNFLKYESPANFPEEELREELNINVEKEEDQFTQTEKAVIGQRSLTSLQEYRDKVVMGRASGVSTDDKLGSTGHSAGSLGSLGSTK